MQWNGMDFQSFHGSSASHASSHQHISENHLYVPLLNTSTRYQPISNSHRAATIPSWINCHSFPFPLQATFWIDIIWLSFDQISGLNHSVKITPDLKWFKFLKENPKRTEIKHTQTHKNPANGTFKSNRSQNAHVSFNSKATRQKQTKLLSSTPPHPVTQH